MVVTSLKCGRLPCVCCTPPTPVGVNCPVLGQAALLQKLPVVCLLPNAGAQRHGGHMRALCWACGASRALPGDPPRSPSPRPPQRDPQC